MTRYVLTPLDDLGFIHGPVSPARIAEPCPECKALVAVSDLDEHGERAHPGDEMRRLARSVGLI